MRPGDLRALLGVPFTDEQLAAACAPLGPSVIVAGAGSGKTSVVAARVVWLVGSGQVRPEQVLGLTFTNKAAGELADRVRSSLARLERSGVAPGSDGEPTVATYHAYSGRLVAEHGLRIGVEPRSRLLADATRFQLAARVVRRYDGPVTHLTLTVGTVVDRLLSLDGELSDHLVEPARLRCYDERLVAEVEALPKPAAPVLDVAQTARQRGELLSFVEAYRAEKRRRDVLDFGDQVALATRLALERPEVGRCERERYAVVLLDEYQDTSVGQRRLLTGLFGGGHPVTAVGDPCQAIYGWRGASVANLDGFPQHFPDSHGTAATRHALRTSQRSGGRLLSVANRLAARLHERHRVDGLLPRPERVEQGESVVALLPTWAEEVGWLGEQVEMELAGGRRPQDIAVLLRKRSGFAAVHGELTRRGVPVQVVGLGGLLSLPEVADLVAVLELLDDPTANPALLRLLTGPRWRIGARDLALLGRRAAHLARGLGPGQPGDVGGPAGDPAVDLALEEAVAGTDPCDVVALVDAVDSPGGGPYSAECRLRLAALGAELRTLRSHLGEPLLDLVLRVLDVTGLGVEVAASPQTERSRALASLTAFSDVLAAFVDLDGEQSLTALLAFLRAADEHDRGLDQSSPDDAEAVQVLTVHKAKGLEWEVVMLPDLTEGVFPSSRQEGRRWTSCPQVLPWPLRGDHGELPRVAGWTKLALAAFDHECKAELELEERRLAYVAVTRARARLYASSHWWGPTQKRKRGPSAYLRAIRERAGEEPGLRVAVWSAEPDAAATNPALWPGEAAGWPRALEPAALAARQAAADAVRSVAALLADGGHVADPAGLTDADRALLAGWDRDAELLVEELRADRAGVREVPVPRSLSATQLVRLQADPDGLARDLARPMPQPPVPAARRGTRFHAWVEQHFGQVPLLDPDALDDGDGTADDTDLVFLREAFLASDYGDRPPYAVEAPFELALDGRVLRGRIDAVYRTAPGHYEVVDWKTGRTPADPLQLAVYRVAWAQLADVPLGQVSAAFLHVRDGRVERPTGLPDATGLARLLRGGGPPAGGQQVLF